VSTQFLDNARPKEAPEDGRSQSKDRPGTQDCGRGGGRRRAALAYLLDRKAARRLVAVTLSVITASAPINISAAEAPGNAIFIIKPGGVYCKDYFAIKDAEAAASSGDGKWFAETHCNIAFERNNTVRAILDGNPNEPSDILRIRISAPAGDATVYLRGRNVVTWLPEGRWQTLACQHGGGWRCDK
jgi:hypothetical protein